MATQSRYVKTFGRYNPTEPYMWLIYKEIGLKALAIRKSLGVSQDVMAVRINRKGSGARIGRLERDELWDGDQEPDRNFLEDIAAQAGLTLDHFRDGEVRDLERQEKLAVLRWLNEATAALKEEVGPTSPSVGDIVVDAQVASGRSNRGRGKKDGRGEPGGPGTEPGATIG